MDEFATPQFSEDSFPVFEEKDIPNTEQVVRAAQEVVLRGVVQQQLDPRNPINQVLVGGATFIMACASLGISAEEAFDRMMSGSAAQKSAAVGYEPGGYL